MASFMYPYIMGFDIKVNYQSVSNHTLARITLVIFVILYIIVMLTLCHPTMSDAALVLFHHTSMLTLRTSLISHVLWLSQA